MALPKFHHVANFFGVGHRRKELAHIGDVSKELLDGSDAIGGVFVTDEDRGEHFEEVFDIAEEEIVFVAVVGIEGGTADFGAIQDVLDGDRVERLLVHESDEGVAKVIARGANATVDLPFDTGEGDFFLCLGPG